MVAGLHEVGVVVRLPDADRERFHRPSTTTPPFVVMGRVIATTW